MSQNQIASRPKKEKAGGTKAAATQEVTIEPSAYASGSFQNLTNATSNTVTSSNILSLQHSVGNKAVQRMIERQRSETLSSSSATGLIQRVDPPISARPGVAAQYRARTGASAPAAAPAAPAANPAQVLYDKLMGAAAKTVLVESLLDGAVQGVVVPELSKGILVKTRADLTDSIKSDAALYAKLGVDDATREKKLEGILQQAVAAVFGKDALLKGEIAKIKGAIKTQTMGISPSSELSKQEKLVTKLNGQKNWAELNTQLVELEKQRAAFYSAQVTATARTYMEGPGQGDLDRIQETLSDNRQIKANLRAQFNTEVDAQLAEQAAPPSAGKAFSTQQAGPKYRKKDLLADDAQAYSEYTAAGAGAASALGGVATKAAQLGEGGFTNFSQFGQTAEAISGFGAAGGVIGVAGGALETVRGIEDMTNSSATTGDRVIGGGGRTVSGVASMVNQGGSAAYNISSLSSGASSAAAMTATTVAGGGAIAMGAVDMVRGGYGAYKADQREERLKKLANAPASDSVKSAATQAASTQNMRLKVAGATVLKGALLVAGGVTLLVLASNPVGWLLLGGAALVGGLAALWRFWKKTKRKKEVAIRELGVEEEFKQYEAKKKEANKGWGFGYSARKAAVAEIKKDNPLHKKMVSMGYGKNAYDKFYADYIHDTSQVLYANGVLAAGSEVPEHQQMRQIVENMGFEVNAKAKTPTAEQIAKALST
ncbi:MAG: hypothetical protein JWP00_1394 [Chloroflexi bacterium]|nr:hypothetical protein [Chloroflexota bacterium]